MVRSRLSNPELWKTVDPDEREFHTRQVLQLPALPMIRDAVLTGIGVAKLPRVLVAEDLATGRLVNWGPASSQPAELWSLHASSRLASAKVKAFMRFFDAAFPEEWL